MGISSVGVGSSILTQDILDQLREADEASFITPIDLSLANENDKKDAFGVLDAKMTNLIDSVDAIKSATVFDGRIATVDGTSVEVSASENSDIQDFTIDVDHLATKQIEQSGAFTASTDTIATGTGSLTLNAGSADPVTIDYDASTTLNDLKNLINDNAGDLVDATVVKISDTESRLFISSVGTGSDQDISITDNDTFLDTNLTTGLSAIQTGIDNQFTFNGQTITRSSNTVDDLITGYEITLKEAGSSNVSVAQDRESLLEKIDSFVSKYNDAITELNALTKSSTDSEIRGIFSGESIIKSMHDSIIDMVSNVGEGVGSLFDYGFDTNKDGTIKVDKTVLNEQLDQNSANFEAFFSGGEYTKSDSSVVTLNGAFNEMSDLVTEFTQYNGVLDQFKNSIDDSITTLNDRKESVTDRLDNKYEILKKQYIAYDAMIAKLNNASDMFVQMANSQNSQNN
ncbi:MAG: flagellar filament capping protein FliD [Sulfurimonas sp.]